MENCYSSRYAPTEVSFMDNGKILRPQTLPPLNNNALVKVEGFENNNLQVKSVNVKPFKLEPLKSENQKMATASLENEHLLFEDGESDMSSASPEKSLNKTERTLLDLSLSTEEPKEDQRKLISEESNENEDNADENVEKIKCKIPKSNRADVIEEAMDDNDATDRKDKENGKNEENGQPKHMELKKSKSYGAPSSRDYVHPKPNLKHSMSVNPNAVKTKGLNIAVFLKEGTGLLLCLENGKQTTAGEVKRVMMDLLSLPDHSQDVFALWLISPLLELQLKTQHVPFQLRREWKGLLKRFTWAKDEEIKKDEPVMVFQRNSFFCVSDERKVTDERVIKRLFEEAKLNILKGRYRIANGDAEVLGGFLARLEHGKFNKDEHTLGYFKKNLDNYLPPSAIKRNWISKKFNKNATEQNLITQYALASERADDPKKFYRLFLEFCWTLPFYGSAFFKGQVEQQSRDHHPWKSRDMNVAISIGREGITIFKEHKTEILLNLTYDELSWDYSQSSEEEGADSFCIEYDTIDNDGKHVANQLQIFSPQAAMMDALVDSCVAEMNRLNIPKSPVDPVFMDDGKPLADQGPPQMKRESKRTKLSLSNPFKFK